MQALRWHGLNGVSALLLLLLFPAPGGASQLGDTEPADVGMARSAPLLASFVPASVNIYAATVAGRLAPATQGALTRVYVPEHGDNSVAVIDPATLKVVDRFKVGHTPQHVVPSWDLKTLWVANNANQRRDGSLTPIDPKTGRPGTKIPVNDPYNVYFLPDGSSAIIVNEAIRRLEFRDPHTLSLQYTIETPDCSGLNHADFTADGRFALFSCEFSGAVTKVDLVQRRVVDTLKLSPQGQLRQSTAAMAPSHAKAKPHGRHHLRHNYHAKMHPNQGMPQDVRLSSDGSVFYVADMIADGVYLIDARALKEVGFIATGVGAHGFCVSRDGKSLYVSNRGSHDMPSGYPGGQGSVTVISFATRAITATWPIPGGGSPDMGSVSADGRQLWFSGRFDDEVYAIDTATGRVTKIPVGREPHGLAFWPQPGRFSLGHTGNMR